MSKLNKNGITIFEALQNIKEGKYAMPAFQRQFVWSMGHIEKLWDSILLHYPIATFLFWRVDDSNVSWDTYFCSFSTEITFNSYKVSESPNYDLINIDVNTTNTAILDGQQRLTSLYLSLFGEAYIRPKNARKKSKERLITRLIIELNENKIDTDENEFNTKKFDIKYLSGKSSPTHFNIKDILSERFQNDSTRDDAIEDAIKTVPNDSKNYARNILQTLYLKIYVEKLIWYTEIIEMGQDDALEMFVRFNSAGKALRKHEITMSILEAYWPSAKTEFGRLLTGVYEGFDTDFIIRTALMLYGDVVKANITKKIADALKNDWNGYKRALINLDKLLKEEKIDVSRISRNWNVLIPIIYTIYYNPDFMECIDAIRAYLLRAEFFIYFRSGTTGKLQEMKKNINEYDYKVTFEMLDQIYDLRVTDARVEDILEAEVGNRVTGEVLYYLSLDWHNKAFKYEHDHLHPDNKFNNKPPLITPEDWRMWRLNRNRLPNLHLLEGRSNSSKSDLRLIDYYNDMNHDQKEQFYYQAIIPRDISLEIENFGEFYEARKKMLAVRIRALLTKNH